MTNTQWKMTARDSGVTVIHAPIFAATIEDAVDLAESLCREAEDVATGNPGCEPRTEWSAIISGDLAECSLRDPAERDSAAWLEVRIERTERHAR